MASFRFGLGGPGSKNELVVGTSGGETLIGRNGDDLLVGGGGFDKFLFSRGDGDDIILDFQRDVDLLVFKGVSPRTISYEQTDQGTVVSYGKLGGGGDSVLLWGVTDFNASDFFLI